METSDGRCPLCTAELSDLFLLIFPKRRRYYRLRSFKTTYTDIDQCVVGRIIHCVHPGEYSRFKCGVLHEISNCSGEIVVSRRTKNATI